MSTHIPASDLKELNHYWRLLAAFVNEVDMTIHQDDHTPEQRLAKIEELSAFVRSRMSRRVPPSVVAEDAQARAAERADTEDDDNSAFMAQLKRDGSTQVGMFDEETNTYRMVTVVYSDSAPRLTAASYQALFAEGRGHIGPHEPMSYALNDDGTFFPVLSNPDHGPLTNEEVEMMMREEAIDVS